MRKSAIAAGNKFLDIGLHECRMQIKAFLGIYIFQRLSVYFFRMISVDRKIQIQYDTIGFIPLEELAKKETA